VTVIQTQDSATNTHIVVLAAGQGTRMKSSLPKVLHTVAGLPIIVHVLRAIEPLKTSSIAVVVGHKADLVEDALADRAPIQFVHQEPQLGTGHGLLQAESLLAGATGTLLLLAGDVPLVRPSTLRDLLETHRAAAAGLTVLTANVARPYGYGRILRRNGQLIGIVEERDATDKQRKIREINSGIYAFELAPLFDSLKQLAAENEQGEYYLPDIVSIYQRLNLPIETITLEDADEIKGINSQGELAEVNAIVRQGKNEELMAAGVTIDNPASTFVDADVTVGPDTVLHPGVILEGQTRIGAACEIHSGSRIVDSTLEDGVTIQNHCVITGSRIAKGARIGPFAHLRPESDIGAEVKIGNFVEIKKAAIGAGTKASHLAYLGDATIGQKVNVGAGTIICNYDGTKKHQTVIEDGAFIGSDSQLIAPVTVGKDAYVASGSSITDDVPAGALAVARGRQVNKPGWTTKKRS